MNMRLPYGIFSSQGIFQQVMEIFLAEIIYAIARLMTF